MNTPLNTVFVPIGLIVVAAKMGWDWYKHRRNQRAQRDFSADTKSLSASSPSFARLVSACFGDKAKAERLVACELSKGAINRDRAVLAALDRLERDRAR